MFPYKNYQFGEQGFRAAYKQLLDAINAVQAGVLPQDLDTTDSPTFANVTATGIVKGANGYFGGPTGYSYFEDDGTYVANLEAITWRDEYVGGEYFVPAGAAAPDLVTPTIGGVVTRKYSFDGVNTAESLSNTFEIAHDSALSLVNSGDLSYELHLHLAPSTTGTGTCRFTVDWCYIPPNGAPVAGTQLVLTKAFTGNQQYYNILVAGNLATTAGGFAVGGLIEFTLTRTPTHGDDTYTADVILYKVALHIPCDTLGSREIYTK